MPFKRDADGSLDLYFQNDNPASDHEANWLPAPKGPFNLTMRLYAPKVGGVDRRVEFHPPSSGSIVKPLAGSNDNAKGARLGKARAAHLKRPRKGRVDSAREA